MSKVIKMEDLGRELGLNIAERVEAYKAATVRGVAAGLPLLVAASPVDTGQYADSWDLLETELSVILGNYAPHAPVIEYGARPFTPPMAPLLAWAKRVLQDPSQPPKYSSRVWALAKHTQQKIAREGMKPRAVMELVLPQIIALVKEELAQVG